MSSRYKNPNLWDGCVGAWAPSQQPLGGLTLFDQTNNKNNGTLTSMDPATDWLMDEGGCLDFDKVDDFVSIPDNPKLAMDYTTWSCWYKQPDPADSSLGHLMSRDDSTGGSNSGPVIQIRNANGYIRFWFRVGGTYYNAQSASNPNNFLDTWVHVVGSWDGNIAKIYINGVIDGTNSTPSGAMDSASLPLHFGRPADAPADSGSGQRHKGKMDDARIYDRALDAGEIRQLYNGGQRGVAYEKKRRVISAVTTASTVPYYYNSLLTGSGV